MNARKIGFTLIELMIVVFIIGILAAICVPNFKKARESARSKIGFSVGGAKDSDNFRENIKQGFLPLASAITYEGLFYDYTFDTGMKETSNQLFSPSYCSALAKNPLTGEVETFVSVGLNSNLDTEKFSRKKLNLVVVLDISGSMGDIFSHYYYDSKGQRTAESSQVPVTDSRNKLRVAVDSVTALLKHLNEADRFAMVVFDDQAEVRVPFQSVTPTARDEISRTILALNPRGSTNLESGMSQGVGIFPNQGEINADEFENRIIFLTDAMPNTGGTDRLGFLAMAVSAAQKQIYSTFIGIGVDFNTDLVESITKVRGANYYAVHSAKEFSKRLDKEFEYMVTPLVFNLKLTLIAEGYRIEKVMGSPEANQSTGELMKVNTLFPSPVEEGETRGGIVLLRLVKTGPQAQAKLVVTYEDRSGRVASSGMEISLEKNPDVFDNTGIRKGILLARYVDLMKSWIDSERGKVDTGSSGNWERESEKLRVSPAWKEPLAQFRSYFAAEAEALKDTKLAQEVALLDSLIKLSTESSLQSSR